ncbi:HVO_2523 family zinc finger protein [Halobacterium zhouii]|uniref:HVO_2523 family zinc finger protein n=1 Tax=Halobacterium zhouii TaxID=2902624 RepID=UPI001E2ADA65|nr:HVO_2523 family zinc finger protein [Halobacterium zhouii]
MAGKCGESGGKDAARGSEGDHGGRGCPLCGASMFKRHCKYVCPQHGVIVDCSDPFTF